MLNEAAHAVLNGMNWLVLDYLIGFTDQNNPIILPALFIRKSLSD